MAARACRTLCLWPAAATPLPPLPAWPPASTPAAYMYALPNSMHLYALSARMQHSLTHSPYSLAAYPRACCAPRLWLLACRTPGRTTLQNSYSLYASMPRACRAHLTLHAMALALLAGCLPRSRMGTSPRCCCARTAARIP